MSRASILCFGDSITQLGYSEQGWVGSVSHAYSRKANVINYGFSGYNTRMGAVIAERIFSSEKQYLFSTIWFGANDAASAKGHPIDTEKPLQHVPLAEYEENMVKIIVIAQASSKHAVLVITPPPLDRLRWPDRSNADSAEYGAAAKRAADRVNAFSSGVPVLVIDVMAIFFAAVGQSWPGEVEEVQAGHAPPSWLEFLNDGLHLSAKGNFLVHSAVMASVPNDAIPDSLPLDYPIWRHLPSEKEEMETALSEEALSLLRAHPTPLIR